VSNLHVRDLMTSHVFTVGPDESITTLQDLMSEKRIRHVPVVNEDGAVLGLVSERDVLRRTFNQEADLPLSVRLDVLTAVTVKDIMTWEVETIDVDEDLSTAAQIMLDSKYGCLPVVEESVLAGILTEADFVKFVAEVEAPSRP
jgi:CBS domain-containing membrane protein